MDGTEREALAAAAELEAWRAIRLVLLGQPVAVGGDAQPVVQKLAEIAAASIAARMQELAEPIVSGLALAYPEHKLSQPLLADALADPASEPVPPAESMD